MPHPHVCLLSLPGLRARDLPRMPRLSRLARAGEQAELTPSFPCLTWPVEASLVTGQPPSRHGVVGNGWRAAGAERPVMWTLGNHAIQTPQLWDELRRRDPACSSAVWFPMLAKDCSADYACAPAPIHNPDGSETPWCWSKPQSLYGELRERLGDFPLHHFWGPMAGIESSRWIARSAAYVARVHRPRFSFIYLPHLDYAAQRKGPDSEAARRALSELDEVIGQLADETHEALGEDRVLWLAASEYVITPVTRVVWPNRVLREAGLLAVRRTEKGEPWDGAGSRAWALADHQIAHVYVREGDEEAARRAADALRAAEGVAEVLAGAERARRGLDHPRAGRVVAIAAADAWMAYPWWFDEAQAPAYARRVDIHNKPGYDPLELFWDPTAGGVPLDASLVRGSHGAPAESAEQRGVVLASRGGVLNGRRLRDTDVAGIVTRALLE